MLICTEFQLSATMGAVALVDVKAAGLGEVPRGQTFPNAGSSSGNKLFVMFRVDID